MHEYAIARDLVRRAVAEAGNQGDCRIAALNVRVGPEASVNAESLAFAIRAAGQGTTAEHCRVNIAETREGGLALESIEVVEAPRCA